MDDGNGLVGQEAYEDEHVHQVYEQIAHHFSSTRYKPWPIVERFLKAIPDGSIGLDVGCGNGKYLAANPRVFIIGSDRSPALTRIAAKHQPHAAIVADNLALPHPRGSFDFAISIAVVHHLSTSPRRVAAIKEVLECLRPPPYAPGAPDRPPQTSEPAKVLIYVWALEQKSSRRGWDASHDQDVMVPWVMTGPVKKTAQKAISCSEGPADTIPTTSTSDDHQAETEHAKTFRRYYHLYRSGELQQDVKRADGVVLDSGYEKDNWWVVARRKA